MCVMSLCPSVPLSLCPSVPLSLCPSVPLSLCPSVHLSLCPSVPLSLCPHNPMSLQGRLPDLRHLGLGEGERLLGPQQGGHLTLPGPGQEQEGQHHHPGGYGRVPPHGPRVSGPHRELPCRSQAADKEHGGCPGAEQGGGAE